MFWWESRLIVGAPLSWNVLAGQQDAYDVIYISGCGDITKCDDTCQWDQTGQKTNTSCQWPLLGPLPHFFLGLCPQFL